MTSITSTALPPKPPCSSANGTTSSPISANAAHTVSLHPLVESTIFARLSIEYSFARYRFSESARSCCSSVKSKFIEQLLDKRGRHAAPGRPAGPGGGPGGPSDHAALFSGDPGRSSQPGRWAASFCLAGTGPPDPPGPPPRPPEQPRAPPEYEPPLQPERGLRDDVALDLDRGRVD